MGRPAKPMFATPTSSEVVGDGALSLAGVAEFTSLSRKIIDRAICRGEIEAFRYGRRVLIARREVVRWLAAMREQSLAVGNAKSVATTTHPIG